MISLGVYDTQLYTFALDSSNINILSSLFPFLSLHTHIHSFYLNHLKVSFRLQILFQHALPPNKNISNNSISSNI